MNSENLTLLCVLVPIVVLMYVVFKASSLALKLSGSSWWGVTELRYIKSRWVGHPLLDVLRKVRASRAGRMKICKVLLEEAGSNGESKFLSPKMLKAVEENVHVRWLMSDQLVQAYSMLTREELTRCVSAAFVHSPAEAMLGCVDLAVSAETLSLRLKGVDPELSFSTSELYDAIQQILVGLLRVLSQQDLGSMLRMPVGTRLWHTSRGEGTVTKIISDPLQIAIRFVEDGVERQYAKHSWDKLSTEPPKTAPEQLFESLPQFGRNILGVDLHSTPLHKFSPNRIAGTRTSLPGSFQLERVTCASVSAARGVKSQAHDKAGRMHRMLQFGQDPSHATSESNDFESMIRSPLGVRVRYNQLSPCLEPIVPVPLALCLSLLAPPRRVPPALDPAIQTDRAA